MECTAKVREEVAATLAEVEAECAAYQAGLERLEKEFSTQTSPEVNLPSNFLLGFLTSLAWGCLLPCVT